MKQLSIVFFVIMTSTLSVQSSDLDDGDWYFGMIVLNGGHTLKGEIQYDLDKDVTLFRQDDKVKAFSMYDVNNFRFMDEQRNTLRKFYAMPYQLRNGQSRIMFFELIFEDGFALFNREKTIRKNQAAITEKPILEDEEQGRKSKVKVSQYFVFTPEGKFVKIYTEKDDLADKLFLNPKERKVMDQFIQSNKLDLKNRSDFIKLIYEFV